MIREITKQLKIGLALFLAVFANGMMPAMAAYAADKPVYEVPTDGKITICHRTNSVSNPYTQNTVATEAADGVAGGNGNDADHYGEHKGDVFDPSVTYPTPHNGDQWGDIIPPIPGSHTGLNWTTEGQAIFRNGCNIPPLSIPTKPAVVAPTCEADGSFTLPTDTSDIDWSISPAYAGPGTYAVTATAKNGQVFTGGLTSVSFEITVEEQLPADSDECAEDSESVTPAPVSFNDVCDTDKDTYTIPNVKGVDYFVNSSGTPTAPGTYPASGTVSVEAKAQDGYVLTEPYSDSKEFTNRACKVTICHATASASNPYVKIEVAVEAVDGDLGNDNGKGDHYSEHLGPIYPAVNEDGKWGDIIPKLDYIEGHEGRNWDAEGQALLRNDCNIPVEISVTPGPCAYFDTESSISVTVTGTAKDSTLVIYDESDNVVKTIDIEVDNDGNVTSPTFPVEVTGLSAGTYTVKVEKGEKVLASATVVVALCLYEVTPVAPNLRDFCYDDHDYIVIPNAEGVIYKVNGVVESGYVPFTGTALEVTAEAVDGYELTGYEGPWTFDGSDFTDENCLTITKTAKVASDTNHDGVIGLGDEITWEVTVTNNSDKECESFYVTVDDPNAVLENDGLIEHLGAGESVTLTATSTIKSADIQLCKAVNIASFSAWRLDKREQDLSILTDDNEVPAPLATGEAQASYTLNCPTPGRGSITPPTTVVTELPKTGPEQDSITNLLIGLTASVLVYRSLLWRQERKAALGL